VKEIPKYIRGSDGAAFIEGKRYLQRIHDKRPPLWPWGTALLLGLLLLTLIAIWPFAQGSIQQRAQISAQAALEDGGFEWAEASANGQWVHLTGTPPSIVAGENAEKAVRAARTRTWLGQAKPITRVTTDYVGAEAPSTSTPEPAAATSETVFNNWEFEREGEALTLTGDVPTQAVRTQIVDLAGQSPNVTGITRISDQLVITETPLPEGYLHDAEIGIEALKRCDSGKVTLLKRVLDLRCTLPTAKQARLESLLNQDLLLAEYGTVEVLTAKPFPLAIRPFAGFWKRARYALRQARQRLVMAQACCWIRWLKQREPAPGAS